MSKVLFHDYRRRPKGASRIAQSRRMSKTPRSSRAMLMLEDTAIALTAGSLFGLFFFALGGPGPFGEFLVLFGMALAAALVRLGAKSPGLGAQSPGLGANSLGYRYPLPQGQKVEPPIIAEFLVGLFAKRRYRNGLLQSLEHDFESSLAAGATVRRARWNYWAAALHSMGPQLFAAAKRIGIFGLIADYARRLLH